MNTEKLRIAIPGEENDVVNYVRVLHRLGAVPFVVPEAEMIREDPDFTDRYDGLLIPGGADIDPSRYGQVNTGCRLIDPEKDELQFLALERFDRARKPILGVCNGHQMINVYFGGDLIQDIPTKEDHQRKAGRDAYHWAAAEKGSWLHQLYGGTLLVNSAHHQAVGTLAPELEVCMRAPDGVIEGLKHKTRPVYGVQWHPERMCPAPQEYPEAVDGSAVYAFFLDVVRHGA